MPTVWVTGIMGFLGGHVARRFRAAGWHVAGIGRPRSAARSMESALSAQEFPIVVPGEITSERLLALLDQTGVPDVVVHAAGSGAVGASFTDPFRDFTDSVTSTAVLLEMLRRFASGARLIFTSSAAIYGLQPEGPIDETAEPLPLSPYGAHKLAAEVLCRQAHVSFGQPVTIVRFFSLFGPGLRKQLLWDLANRLRDKPDCLRLNGTGMEKRDLLFIDDAAELVWRGSQDKTPFTLLNGGTGEATSVRDVAMSLTQHLSPDTRIQFDGAVRPGDPRELYADPARLQAFGFRRSTTMEEGLERYVAWLAQDEPLR